MKKEYYLIKDFGENDKVDVDVEGLPVDGQGNPDELDVAHRALEQLGWILCIRGKIQ